MTRAVFWLMSSTEQDVAQQMGSSCSSSCHKPVRALSTVKPPGPEYSSWGWGAVEWMSKAGVLLLCVHCDRGFFIIECASWSLGQRHTTVPWRAGPGCASSSIMQGMARAITRTALSLQRCLPNILIGLKPHALFLLDTGLVFQMNEPSQAFRCFQLRALTSTTGNH